MGNLELTGCCGEDTCKMVNELLLVIGEGESRTRCLVIPVPLQRNGLATMSGRVCYLRAGGILAKELSTKAVQFLSRPIHGVIATYDTVNRLHQVPVNAVLDSTDGSKLFVLSRASSKKVRNITQNPFASFCVFVGQSYVSLAGAAKIESDPKFVSSVEVLYLAKYSKAVRPNPERVVIVIDPINVIEHRLDL